MTINPDNKTVGIKLPFSGLIESKIKLSDALELHTLQNAAVVMNKSLNASALIRAIWSLYQLAAELSAHLAMRCDTCSGCESGCQYDDLDYAVGTVFPDDVLEIAGIPKGTPLHIEFHDDGEISFCVNHDGPGLWDVPAPLMQGFLLCGVCPAGLEKLLKSGETVYES